MPCIQVLQLLSRYWSTPLVRVSLDAIVTLVSLDHPWLPVYPWSPGIDQYIWWTIYRCQYILVYPPCQSICGCPCQSICGCPCQSICGCHSYSGIPGPSMVTSIYWSTPLVRVSVGAIVTLVSLDHPWLPVYTGLPPLSEYLWMP